MNKMFISKFKTLTASLLVVLCTLLPLFAAAEHEYESDYEGEAFSQAELDQMLAPIALYPDALLMQILMASTYPLEVVEAARWSRAHRQPEGDRAVRGVESEDWDPSVKSLVAVPNILLMMDEKLDWTEQLGEAFLAQKDDVMETTQALRRRALRANNLGTTEHMRVVDREGYIIVEPANPDVIYVPYYNPLVIYGDWWWPAYRPVYWEPWPSYHHHHGVSHAILWGATIGVSVGYLFSTPDWHHRDVYVTHTNNYYYPRRTVVVNKYPHGTHRVNTRQVWRHDVGHRGGATYHKDVLQRRYIKPDKSPRQQKDYGSLPGQTPREHPSADRRYQRDLSQPQIKHSNDTLKRTTPDKSKGPDKNYRDQKHGVNPVQNRFNPTEKSPEKTRPQQENRPAIHKFRNDPGTTRGTEPKVNKPAVEQKQQRSLRTQETQRQTPFNTRRETLQEQRPVRAERPVQPSGPRHFTKTALEKTQHAQGTQEQQTPAQFRSRSETQPEPRQQRVEKSARFSRNNNEENTGQYRRFGQ